MAHAKRQGQLIYGDDGGVPAAAFEAADVLLAETANLRELFLGQAFPFPETLDVPADQLAHVHAPRSADPALGDYQL